MTVVSIADITPNSVATALGAAGTQVTWIILVATGTSLRFGDSGVSATEGVKLPTGVPVHIPRCDFNQGRYDLSKIYVYGTGSDAVSITYGD